MSAKDGPMRVLWIEGAPDAEHAAMALLSDAGADVVRVASAEGAVARVEHDAEIDVLMLDLGPPEIAPLDVLRKVRENTRAEVPIVVLTPAGDTDLALRAIAVGAQDALPMGRTDSSALTRAIVLARERQRRVSQADRERAIAMRATAAKTEFLANVSHEIRTPLNTMLGMAELLEESGLSPEQSRRLETLRRAGDHLLAIVDDALDLSRIEAGRLTLESAPFDLARLIDGAIAFLRPAAQRKGIELRVVWDGDVCKQVVGDARRLRQILVNLLQNGVKFTAAGFVRIVVASDSANPTRGAVRISVEDTGIGIGPNRFDAIFGSFVQGDPSIAARYGGAGLGLHIVKGLVDLMGGRVWAESGPDGGSRFHVALVMEPSEEPASPRSPVRGTLVAESSTLNLAGLRVLMVDDSEESRALVADYLAPCGAELVAENDARCALETLAHETFDVVLMDLHLPDIDGFVATRALRQAEAERGSRTVPVIALSADALPDTVRRALASGFSEHLAKPVRKADLMAALRRHAVEGSGRRPSVPALPTRSRAATALLPKFLGHRARDVQTLREALARLDFTPIGTIAHNMRGNGVSYGCPEISEIGLRLEGAAAARDARSVEDQIAHLEACLDRIRAAASSPAPPVPRPASSTRVRAAGRSIPGDRAGKA